MGKQDITVIEMGDILLPLTCLLYTSHLPYKQGVTGSSPVVPTKFGPVVQLVRMLARCV